MHQIQVRALPPAGEVTGQLGLGYRTSSLTKETREAPGPVRAGDRAPDGTMDGARLFEAYSAGVFLIRPDGYVGWAGDTSAGLAAYAARVGAGQARAVVDCPGG